MAAERAQRFASGHTFTGYEHDDMLRAAVERQLEILGEALSRLRKEHPETAASIPDVHRAIAMRNILIHGYAAVDHRLVWGVVEEQVPRLHAVLRQMLAAED